LFLSFSPMGGLFPLKCFVKYSDQVYQTAGEKTNTK
jgi:hypothetical protein